MHLPQILCYFLSEVYHDGPVSIHLSALFFSVVLTLSGTPYNFFIMLLCGGEGRATACPYQAENSVKAKVFGPCLCST